MTHASLSTNVKPSCGFASLTMHTSLCLCLSAALLCGIGRTVRAQDTQGVEAETGRRAVIKAKAPVAKDLLRVKLPRPYEVTLPNGLRILVLEDHRLPVVRFALTLKAGTLIAPKPGVAELTASMLSEGTTTRSATEISELLEDRGATLGAQAGPESTVVTVSGTSDQTQMLASLMADAVLHPALASDALDKLRAQRGGFGGGGGRGGGGGGRRGGAGSPNALAAQRAERLFYAGTPYARTPATTAQRNALTANDLRAYYDAYYHPNGATLGITGDVKATEVVAMFTELMGDWKPGASEPSLPTGAVTPKEATHIYLIDRPASTQTYLLFGNVGVTRTDPDYVPLVVANHILGGGASARLFQNLREDKGYTYGASSNLTAPRWPGLWQASASVRTPVTEPAVKEFFYEFKRIQTKPVSVEELARAKRALIGSFARTLESADGELARAPGTGAVQPARRLLGQLCRPDRGRHARRCAARRPQISGRRPYSVDRGRRTVADRGSLKKYGPVTVVEANQRPAPTPAP